MTPEQKELLDEVVNELVEQGYARADAETACATAHDQDSYEGMYREALGTLKKQRRPKAGANHEAGDTETANSPGAEDKSDGFHSLTESDFYMRFKARSNDPWLLNTFDKLLAMPVGKPYELALPEGRRVDTFRNLLAHHFKNGDFHVRTFRCASNPRVLGVMKEKKARRIVG